MTTAIIAVLSGVGVFAVVYFIADKMIKRGSHQ